jgi:hypothetical protein
MFLKTSFIIALSLSFAPFCFACPDEAKGAQNADAKSASSDNSSCTNCNCGKDKAATVQVESKKNVQAISQGSKESADKK